jgi:hypothetical protein
MYKNATKCNETLSKWCKNKHGASKIMDTLETYQSLALELQRCTTQASTTQAVQGKLLVDHDRRTIRGRRHGLKIEQPPLRHVKRANDLAAVRHKTVTQTMQPNALPHEASARHGSRGHRLDVHPPSGAATSASTDPNIEEAMHNRQS